MMPMAGRRMRRRVAAKGLARKAVAMALLAGGLLLASAFVSIEAQRSALAHEGATVEAQIATAQARNAQLQADIAQKKTDAYVMDRARDYGYVRPGEALIGVQRDAMPATVIASGPSVARLQRWIAIFFLER